MNYEALFPDLALRSVRLALVGAKGAYGRSLLAQCRFIPAIKVTALCDLDLDALAASLVSLGHRADAAVACSTLEEVAAATGSGRIALVRDHALLAGASIDVTVDATGQPEVACRVAEGAIARGSHVVMVTKECDAVAGPYLHQLAAARGLVYTTGDGDQPSNLIELVSWARLLGLEVIAAGKSSEYDYVVDHGAGTVTYLDRVVDLADVAELWEPSGRSLPALMAARSELLRALPQSATPDYTEMNLVANATGLAPSSPTLSYPLCRITELADAFAPHNEGGLLERTGVVDVFNCLRRHDEVSFGGGVFVVVRCLDSETWEVLRGKGHIVSRDGRRACIYRPYHLLGLETPLTILSAALHGQPTGGVDQGARAIMVAEAERDFAAGEHLTLAGHHHVVEGLRAKLLPLTAETARLAPYYLVADKPLVAPVHRGEMLTPTMVDLTGSALAPAWRAAVSPNLGS